MGIPCPYVLLDAIKERKRDKVPIPEDIVHDELKKEAVSEGAEVKKGEKRDPIIVVARRPTAVDTQFRGVSQEDWEALLLEIARRSAAQDIKMPVAIPIPTEFAQEAFRHGARGKTISLWVAAVAAVLAAGAALGPQGALQVPRTVGAIMSSARTQGRGGFHNNAAAELDILLEGGILKKQGATGTGDFFPGILG